MNRIEKTEETVRALHGQEHPAAGAGAAAAPLRRGGEKMIVWQLILYCLLFTGMAAALVLIVGLWNRAADFWSAYWQSLLFLEVMNWYDGIVIDELWVGRSGFWVIPELADMPYVQTWPQMLRKRALLSLVWVAGAALTAGLAVLLF